MQAQLKKFFINSKTVGHLEDEFKQQLSQPRFQLQGNNSYDKHLSDFGYVYFKLDQIPNLVKKENDIYPWCVVYLYFRSGQFDELDGFLKMQKDPAFKRFQQWLV